MANVNIATVQVTNTFDEWRVATNDLITDRNILRNANYVKDDNNFTIANGELNISRSTGGVLLRISGTGGADIGGLTETTDLSVTDTANIFLANVETTLEVSGNTYLYSNAIISKNTVVSQNANVLGTFNVVTRLISVGNANLNSNLLVGANTTVNQNLYVTGTSEFSNTVSILRDLYVYQNVFVTDTLSVTKNLAVPNLVVSNVLYSDLLKTTSNTLQLRANAAVNDSGYFSVVRPTSSGNHATLKWNETDKIWEVLVGSTLSNVAAARVNTSVANITTANITTANISTLSLPAGGSANISVANVGELQITAYGTVIDTSGQWVGDPTGLSGPQGAQGVQGAQGAQGFQGVQGATGAQGVQGTNGTIGTQGAQGFQGFQGVQGTNGTIGTQGAQGFQGLTGAQGVQGALGNQGYQGYQGVQGALGSQGYQGYQGVEGPTGAQFWRHVTGGFTGSGRVFVTGTAPGSPSAGDIWLDTSGTAGFTQSFNSLPFGTVASSWTKLPNGLLVQWGMAYTATGFATVTFPTAFTGVPAVVCSSYRNSSGSRGMNHVYDVSASGASLVIDANYGYWIAIGYV